MTVQSIISEYHKFFKKTKQILGEIIISGGGLHNRELMGRLRRVCDATFKQSINIIRHEDTGIDSDGKEAILFALLAYLHEKDMYGNIPSVTGASCPRILGKRSSIITRRKVK